MNLGKKRELFRSLLMIALLLVGISIGGRLACTSVFADTLKHGFIEENGKTYFYTLGRKTYGFVEVAGKVYYFSPKTGVMVTGWLVDSNGNRRCMSPRTGEMVKGWVPFSTGMRYFDQLTGIMKKGWLTVGARKYYFDPITGLAKTGYVRNSDGIRYFMPKTLAMYRGWANYNNGKRRYFMTSSVQAKDGVMATGLTTIAGKTYYFSLSNGLMIAGGWFKNSTTCNRYYFDENGVMATGIKTINGKRYLFASNGVCRGIYTGNENGETAVSDGKKTIRNYLIGALLPVGQTLYIWGGGYGYNDCTRKGVSPLWKSWFDSQSSSYNYYYYDDLTPDNRAKGLDCSGVVGWVAYQVMHSASGQGSGYTVVSGDIGSSYTSRGWGQIINQYYLSSNGYTLKPGDIGYNEGHTWIVLGQCADKSVVIVHSTPDAGVQIAGTAVPTTGASNSQAAALAEKYMKKFYPSSVQKYEYYYSVGNYIRQYNFLRWNRSTLADPDGYMNKTADQILADLYGWS